MRSYEQRRIGRTLRFHGIAARIEIGKHEVAIGIGNDRVMVVASAGFSVGREAD